eukprot:CAMPEP_0182931082 /NCGR_PEP_ID=MMETSP0105_2-20130417/27370_1 /TAXON_ID=81532 ORGANISM="Acanthoeca-like sp., Strain 10tr" /NCGR_SAMPLE_ID=MMETSP0105_2 /ASSEMBLY_ACC=CAM_ASM_000205 /LENGTH=67 /DNA_ID=CAMNT_0025069463 /DNA_START=1 /DNA_END=201 /DNA_ORIENTATION=+
MMRASYPSATLHLNWKWGDLTAAPGYPNPSGVDVAGECGRSELDWISSDEYYDVSIAQYRQSYEERV